MDSKYHHTFISKGIYVINYKFNKLLISAKNMFSDCRCLLSLDLSNFNAQNITDMSYMFFGCESLLSINLSNFNTQKVTTMEHMFFNCNSLPSLNLSSFNTKNVPILNSFN